MNISTILSAAAAITLLLPATSFAQTRHPALTPDRTVTVINKSADSPDTVNVYNIFVENAPKTFHISGAPRFAIRGSEGKFYLGIGGTLKAVAAFDFPNPISSPINFTTSQIPDATPDGSGGQTTFSAQASHIFINFVALPSTKNQIGVYMNANFSGDNYGPRIKYAYIRYRGIVAGYNYSLFTDQGASPASIDNEGPSAMTSVNNGVFDYIHTFTPHWNAAVGLEKPMLSATVSATTSIVSQRIPDIPVYVKYSWAQSKAWVRLADIFRGLQYRDLTASKNVTAAGWGVSLSGSMPLIPFITAYYQATYGRGISSYYQDLTGMDLDLTPSPDDPGHLTPAKSWGAYIGLQYNISRRIYATTTYSQLRVYSDLPADHISYTQYALANLMWRITPELTGGVEYIYGRRVNTSPLSRHDNRIQAMLRIDF